MHARAVRSDHESHGLGDRASGGNATPWAAEFYSDALAVAGIGAWSCDLRDETLTWSPMVFDIFGLQQSDRIERTDTVAMYCEESREMLHRLRSCAIADCGTFSLEARIIRPDAEERWIRVKAATRSHRGKPLALFGTKEDITSAHIQWTLQRGSGQFDPLTGLPTRAQFQADFLDLAPGGVTLAALKALTVFRIDNLREINRQWGTSAGDACLIALARRLSAGSTGMHMPTRLGGRTFAVLANGARLTGRRGAQQLPEDFADAVLWRGTFIPLSLSLGIASLMPGQMPTPEALFEQAALALDIAVRQSGASPRVSVRTCDVADRRAPQFADQANRAGWGGQWGLSRREAQVLRLIVQGRTNDQIACSLELSPHTVRNFIRRLYMKLEVSGRVEAVRLALVSGL
ncbi:LuxR C-terminal-related transcriptional regulator [Novosphingobium sp. BW1]|uniref:LuxR C-terminal-related transcriptional regulator n=1 Tax=Novosphingobium sp. BW1 TaxID=2592621 RepID=UPI0011DE815A|nr:LuxR C-terminal-related transcriptional regulator [Novosphingobium sp. BW1]TYC90092.1 diguanylate cyclase [Novosphingobium sp. BW1]